MKIFYRLVIGVFALAVLGVGPVEAATTSTLFRVVSTSNGVINSMSPEAFAASNGLARTADLGTAAYENILSNGGIPTIYGDPASFGVPKIAVFVDDAVGALEGWSGEFLASLGLLPAICTNSPSDFMRSTNGFGIGSFSFGSVTAGAITGETFRANGSITADGHVSSRPYQAVRAGICTNNQGTWRYFAVQEAGYAYVYATVPPNSASDTSRLWCLAFHSGDGNLRFGGPVASWGSFIAPNDTSAQPASVPNGSVNWESTFGSGTRVYWYRIKLGRCTLSGVTSGMNIASVVTLGNYGVTDGGVNNWSLIIGNPIYENVAGTDTSIGGSGQLEYKTFVGTSGDSGFGSFINYGCWQTPTIVYGGWTGGRDSHIALMSTATHGYDNDPDHMNATNAAFVWSGFNYDYTFVSSFEVKIVRSQWMYSWWDR